ncbi:hypothetical protein LSTR_LSTR004104 [Laodelphax striatellus]|uniref:Uncharacterized protein n=1 Tax=Laodelphax striatellus TaxID=195883 RepID=A0A482WHH0_LAOST|nr:hypothetical protein LSTR_LSTR004104 [Laodelphax striatellus]
MSEEITFPTIIHPKTLRDDLLELQKKLQKNKFQPAIPVSHLQRYYELPIATCNFHNENIDITIKIPITTTGADYQINIEEHQLFEKTWLSPTTTTAAIMGVRCVTRSGPRSDNSIIGYEYHSHAPLSTSFKANDEKRIRFNSRTFTQSYQKAITCEFKVTNAANAALAEVPVSLDSLLTWSEIRYEINGVIVDSICTLELPA